mgnify:CR=1 FL=1
MHRGKLVSLGANGLTSFGQRDAVLAEIPAYTASGNPEILPMGAGTQRKDSLIVEVDTEDPEKDLAALDIPLP